MRSCYGAGSRSRRRRWDDEKGNGPIYCELQPHMPAKWRHLLATRRNASQQSAPGNLLIGRSPAIGNIFEHAITNKTKDTLPDTRAANQRLRTTTIKELPSHFDSTARLRPGEPGYIPDGVTPRFSHVGIVRDDAAGRRVSSGIPRFPIFISALLRAHLASHSSALKTSMLRAAQISLFTSRIFLLHLVQTKLSPKGQRTAFKRTQYNHCEETAIRLKQSRQTRTGKRATLELQSSAKMRCRCEGCRTPEFVLITSPCHQRRNALLVSACRELDPAAVSPSLDFTAHLLRGLGDPMRVIEVSMEQRRNERMGEREIPEKTRRAVATAPLPCLDDRLPWDSRCANLLVITASRPQLDWGREERSGSGQLCYISCSVPSLSRVLDSWTPISARCIVSLERPATTVGSECSLRVLGIKSETDWLNCGKLRLDTVPICCSSVRVKRFGRLLTARSGLVSKAIFLVCAAGVRGTSGCSALLLSILLCALVCLLHAEPVCRIEEHFVLAVGRRLHSTVSPAGRSVIYTHVDPLPSAAFRQQVALLSPSSSPVRDFPLTARSCFARISDIRHSGLVHNIAITLQSTHDLQKSRYFVAVDSTTRCMPVAYGKINLLKELEKVGNYFIDKTESIVVVRLLVSHRGETGPIPGETAPGFSFVGILPDDAAGRRVFSGISRLRCACIPALLHSHLAFIGSQDLAVKSHPNLFPDPCSIVALRGRERAWSGAPLGYFRRPWLGSGPSRVARWRHVDNGLGDASSRPHPAEVGDFLHRPTAYSPAESSVLSPFISHTACHDKNTARLARRSDEMLGMRVNVARIAPSLLDLERAATYYS
ncbi:hypothetical protein PR048_017695 [Dryococelus australis]|uniref:Uncharacterized protein n=1 Tax=Dryococelus australis TaxID=614101 RepID=A0ABQ9HA76_9NEOP|nr:hypothetical protein PR048_017695 [Dryococelus australis]